MADLTLVKPVPHQYVIQTRGLQGPPGEAGNGDVAIADVTGLQTALDGKAATSHTHAQSAITGLVSDLAGKAASSHSHAISDTTGLQTALDAKAATSHTHAQSEITGLVSDLAGKAASSHSHAIADTTGLQTALDGKSANSHTHTISDTTGLQTALDGKQDIDATLTAISGVTTSANKLIYASGTDAFATCDLTSFARTLLDDADAAAARTTLGLVIGTDVLAPSGNGSSLTGITFSQIGSKVLDGEFWLETPTVKTITRRTKARSARTINGLYGVQTSAGTVTFTVKINGTAVTGLTNITATTTPTDYTATAANTVAVGDVVTIDITAVSSGANLRFTGQETLT